MLYILSQVLVFITDGFYVCSMLSKRKSKLVLFLIASDILFASHYLCLGGFTGAANIFVDVVYLIVIFLLEKYGKERYNLLATIIAMIISIVLTVLTWSSVISLLPMFSLLIYLVGMMFKNVVVVKCGALVRNTLNVIYMFLIYSYLGAGLEICLMISAIIGIIINVKNKEKQQDVSVLN